jgi:hypothetical protein
MAAGASKIPHTFFGVTGGAVLAQLLMPNTARCRIFHCWFVLSGFLCSLLSQLAPVQWQLVTISLVAAQQR